MPPSLYNCKTGGYYNNKEEMLSIRKSKDNTKQKIRYWRKKYGYDLNEKDYNEFSMHSSNIKHIYDIHDWFINYQVGDNIPEEIHDIFFSRQSYILRALLSQNYIRTLKKIETEENLSESPKSIINNNEKYVIEF